MSVVTPKCYPSDTQVVTKWHPNDTYVVLNLTQVVPKVGMAKRAPGIHHKNSILDILWTSNAPSLFFVGHTLKSWMLLSVSWYFLWPIFSATENTMRLESSMLFEKTSKRSRFQFLPRPVCRDWGHGAISHYLSLCTLYSLYNLSTFLSFWMNTVT